jgi:hypothetical protein
MSSTFSLIPHIKENKWYCLSESGLFFLAHDIYFPPFSRKWHDFVVCGWIILPYWCIPPIICKSDLHLPVSNFHAV